MISKNQIKWVRQLEHKKYRTQEGLFVAEGPKVVGDLLRAGMQPRAIFCTSEGRSSLGERLERLRGDACGGSLRGTLSDVSSDELCRLSLLQHPQQVVGIFRIPMPPNEVRQPLHELTLALDGVQDPGNVGTIIRLADWFGISTVFCSPDTADAYNPKVVQASMGSIAHVRIVYTPLPLLLDQLPGDYPVYGTLLDGDDIYQQALTPHGIIVMGNEGNGISPAVRERVNRRLYIPNFNTDSLSAESLNVAIATAITCSEFRRQALPFTALRTP